MKVWLLAEVMLARAISPGARRLPARTCLMVCEDQSLTPFGALAVYGQGCFDIIPIDWLTFNPNI